MTASAKRIIITGVAMAVVMVAAAAAVWIGLNRRYKAPSPMRCLPSQTAIVVRLGDRRLLPSLAGGAYGSEMTDVMGGERARQLAERVDTLFGGDVISDPSLGKRDIYISYSLNAKGEIDQLAASFCLRNRMEWHKAMSELRNREGVSVRDTAFNGHGLFLLREEGYSEPLYMAAGGGCLFASTTPDLLMSFGKDSVTPMCEDPYFAQIERTTSPSAIASIYVNGKEIGKSKILSVSFCQTFANVISEESKGADWMAFDLGMDDEGMSADGFAVAQKPSLAMLTSRENSSAIGLARRLPKGLAWFNRIGAGRRGISSPAFSDFLSQDTIGSTYRNAQSEVYAHTGVDIEALLSQVFESELALCQYKTSKSDSTKTGDGTFFVVDTHGGTKAHALITQALTALHGGASPMVIGEIQPGASAVPQGVVSVRADAEQVSNVSIPVYGGFEKSDNTFFLNIIFGRKVPGKLFFRYEDALVFANDMATLRRVLVDYVTGNTLEGDPHFEQLMVHFGNDCSTFTYDATTGQSVKRTDNRKGAFDIICHQMTRTGNLPYISVYAHVKQTNAEESVETIETTWRTRVDSVRNGWLWGVANHYTKLTECLTQDAENKVCLIGADGMLLWRRPVDGGIVGNVSQIDYYNNGKLQYLFTTENSLYVIDRLGNDVGPFPVRLPSKSQSGASHAQYSDGSPMRLFVGCKNGPVVYGPDGKLVDGWKATKPEGIMRGAPKHLVCAQKDYIVYHDQYAYYYADRRGNRRLATTPLDPSDRGEMSINGNGQYFVTTSSSGNVVAINGDTGDVTRLELDSVGSSFISRSLSSSTYAVLGNKMAYLVDVSGDNPRIISKWATGLESLMQIESLDGLIIALDGKAGQAHVYTAVDGCEIAASPFRARGSVALGYGCDGIVAFTLGETGEIIQVNLTRGRQK